MAKWLDRRRKRKQRTKEFAELNRRLSKELTENPEFMLLIQTLFDCYMKYSIQKDVYMEKFWKALKQNEGEGSSG